MKMNNELKQKVIRILYRGFLFFWLSTWMVSAQDTDNHIDTDGFFYGNTFKRIFKTEEKSNKLLDGKWVLETTAIHKILDGDTVKVEVDMMKHNSFFALYDTLLFVENTLTIPSLNTFSKGEYRWTEGIIEIPFMAAPHELEFTVEEEKIFFTQHILFGCRECMYLVQTVYKRENHENDH